MPSAMQCLQACLGSSGFSRAHRTLRALQASQPGKHVRSLARDSPVTDGERILRNQSYSGIDACVRGKGWEKSQQRGFREGEEGGHWRIRAGLRMQGVKSGAREMVEEEDKQDMTGDRS